MPRGVNMYDEGRIQRRNFSASDNIQIISPGVVTDGLLLYLDAGNYSSYPASGTVWSDLSGNRNNGTLTNGPTFNTNNGGYIVFDGTNDYINCGTDLAISGGWTLSGFIMSSVSSRTQIILQRSSASPSFSQNYGIFIVNNNKFGCGTSADSYKRVESSTTMATNTWYYVTGLYNSATKILSIYINGNFEASSTALVGDPPTTGTQYTTLGAGDGLSVASRLTGNIAYASIYTRALSASEILQNFNATRARFGI